MWCPWNIRRVGEFFWLGIWNLLILRGLVGAVLGGCAAFFGTVRWCFCLRLLFFGSLRSVLTDLAKDIVLVSQLL